MVVWRSLVSRTVYLHTGTMGVHRACFYRLNSESHYPGTESPRKIVSLSCAAFLLSRTNWRAPGKNRSAALTPWSAMTAGRTQAVAAAGGGIRSWPARFFMSLDLSPE